MSEASRAAPSRPITAAAASNVKTAESKERTDIQAPPNCFVLVEACIPKTLEKPVHLVRVAFGLADVEVGSYLHEYTRPKTDWGPG